MRCAVVVPCYNEASRFPLDAFRNYLRAPAGADLVFVNDGSRDATLATLEGIRQEFPERVEVIDKQPNAGKAEAVRTGILHALDGPAEIVGFWDADLATPLEAIGDLLQPIAANPKIQMVFGARVKLMGRDIERRAVRHYLGRVFATTVSMVLGLPIYDTQCGAKLFRANDETRRMFAEPFHSRWVFDVELLARFINLRERRMASIRAGIYEFPLSSWRDVGGSKLKAKDFLRAFLDVVGIRRKYKLPPRG